MHNYDAHARPPYAGNIEPCEADIDSVRSVSPYLHSWDKRAIDFSAAIVMLLFFLPVMLVIAVLVKTTSTGPVLFRQKRHGIQMRPFYILKFRTMKVLNNDGPVQQACRCDPRVTPLGRILRQLSLDELPQLFNVLRGEMSLVGPRPHATIHDQSYIEKVSQYGHRFVARPGLTGLAQVRGARGGTPLVSDMQRRIDYDIEYICNASAALDALILLKTVRELGGSKNAF